MKECGIVIFKDGEVSTFGKYVPIDHPDYHNYLGHEASFKEEIVKSMHFKFLEHNYDKNRSYYSNAISLSLEGMMLINNNQQSVSSHTEVLCYMPVEATEEQIIALEENEKLQQIQIQRIYVFDSDDYDDYVEFASFKEYIEMQKTKSK